MKFDTHHFVSSSCQIGERLIDNSVDKTGEIICEIGLFLLVYNVGYHNIICSTRWHLTQSQTYFFLKDKRFDITDIK